MKMVLFSHLYFLFSSFVHLNFSYKRLYNLFGYGDGNDFNRNVIKTEALLPSPKNKNKIKTDQERKYKYKYTHIQPTKMLVNRNQIYRLNKIS